MPRLLAIEWNQEELRAVVAKAGGGLVEIEGATTIPLSDEARIAEPLKAWLVDSGIGKVSTLAAVGGLQVELHEISLPPAPAEELPDLVRFQIQHDVTAIEDDTPLDFVVLSGNAETAYHILAAIIPTAMLTEAQEICHKAGVRLSRMALRPCATALLADRFVKQSAGVHLVVHPIPNEVDIVAVMEGAVQLIRTVRLPGGTHEICNPNALIGEVRRTVASVRQQMGEQGVDRITVCGSRASHSALAMQIAEQLDLSTVVFDPIETIELKGDLSSLKGADAGEFVPLIGMILDAAHERPSVFDFVHPRQRSKEPSKNRPYALLAVVMLLLVTWYSYWQYHRFSLVDQKIDVAKQQIDLQEPKLASCKETERKAKRIAGWLRTDVTWLDELDRLSRSLRPLPLTSKEYPSDQDIVVTQLRLTPYADGGHIELDAIARSRDAMPPFEKRLRDSQHLVEVISGDATTDRPGYQWDFNTTVKIETPDGMTP